MRLDGFDIGVEPAQGNAREVEALALVLPEDPDSSVGQRAHALVDVVTGVEGP